MRAFNRPLHSSSHDEQMVDKHADPSANGLKDSCAVASLTILTWPSIQYYELRDSYNRCVLWINEVRV
jgi:hypothetical protein